MRWGASAVVACAMAWMFSTACAPVFAQTPEDEEDFEDEPFDRDCMDEYGRNLCDAATWSGIVSSFELQPAEQVQREGWRGVRVFTVNGYSNDMPMVSVLAAEAGHYDSPVHPKLEVRGTAYRGSDDVMVAKLEREAWDGLHATAQRLQGLVAESQDRQSGAAPEDPPKTVDGDRVISICLHAWVTVTESLTEQGVTRRIRNACGDDPVFDASFDFSAHALRGFPHCNHIDPALQRNESTQLAACLALEGEDKVAAAEVLNILHGPVDEAVDLAGHLAPDVRLFEAGDPVTVGAAPVAQALSAGRFNEMRVYTHHFEGRPESVITAGSLQRYVDDKMELADTRQVWLRRDGIWRLAEMTVGPRSLVD